jgi:hypothetical protein
MAIIRSNAVTSEDWAGISTKVDAEAGEEGVNDPTRRMNINSQ